MKYILLITLCLFTSKVHSQSNTTDNSNTTGRVFNAPENQWLIRFYWPSSLTEDQRQWTRDYYLYRQNDYVYFYSLPLETGLGARLEEWVISEHLTRFYAVPCDGCTPLETNPNFRIQVEAIETF